MKMHEVKITLRRLIKEKLYSVINIGGLAVGMAAALLIFLYIFFELSYDKYHPEHENIYRIGTDFSVPGQHDKLAINSVRIGPLLVEQRPEFVDFLRIFPANYFFRNLIYRYEEKNFFEDGVFAVDSTLFNFFDFEFIHGEPENALNKPFSIVMTRSMAERYFGDENPMGKTIEVEGAGSFMVSAVIQDPPVNSHFQFSGLFSMETMKHLNTLLEASFAKGFTWQIMERSNGTRLVWVYVKTVPDFDPQEFNQNVWKDFYDTHIETPGINEEVNLIFQPMADIHLKSKLEYEMTSETGAVTMMSPEMIRIFFIVAVFLLLIASINYTNIAISRFNRRSKEVGVKKVMGATRKDLVRQFFSESIITTLISLVFALLLAELTIPYVNRLLNADLTLNFLNQPELLLILGAVALFVALIAGGYPALYFSSFSPIKVLGYRFRTGHKTLTLKKGLIVLQFSISVLMIIATMVVGRQLNYINKKDLGFDREHVVIVELQDSYSRTRAEVLKNELEKNPLIKDVVISNFFPSILTMFNGLSVEGETGEQFLSANVAQVSPDYIEFMQMKLSRGRFFTWENLSDFQEAVVINEAAQKHFGWDEPLGKKVSNNFTWPDGTSCMNRKVIGVLEDFHYSSLNKPVEPMVFYPMKNNGNYINLKISGSDFPGGIKALEKAWKNFRPNSPLQYHILDQVIASMYNSQKVLGIFFASFAWLCIIIAFIGLYGLSAYSVEQRTREVGIRKVLGATLSDVFSLLGREFLWLIVISVLIASSLAFYFMSRWISGFAFNAGLSSMPFIIGVLSAFLIAFLAVGVHALKANKLLPAKALKYE